MANDLDYSIIIGVEHYKENPLLAGPHRDATDFYNWLTDEKGGDIPAQNIGTFLSTPTYTPTQDDVDDWINNILTVIQQSNNRGRRLYFYFSGHGIGVNAMNSAMLLPKWTLSMRNYALSSERYLLELVNKGIFKEIFFFMDCCRNRIPGVQGQSPLWASAIPATVSCEYLLYYASEFDNPAFESALPSTAQTLDNLLPHGLFTTVLLNGLKGAACDRDGSLKVQDLVNYVKRKLPELASSVGKTQIPRPKIEIDLEKEITGPFEKLVDISIQFQTPGLQMILENPELISIKEGNSSEGQWDLKLQRGQYTLRKVDDINSQKISVDGTQINFMYA